MAAQPTVPYGTPVAATNKGGGKKVFIIIAIVVLLLCCCITVGAVVFFMNKGVDSLSEIGDIGEIVTDATEPSAMTTADDGQTGTPGKVMAWLEWSEPVDMDLEIWDSTGENFMFSAYSMMGEDVTTGGAGQETFEFTDYEFEDLSTGTYVISVYFAELSPDEGEDFANVTLTVQDAEGNVRRFMKKVLWDPGFDQWHAVKIDAATGEMTDLDEWF